MEREPVYEAPGLVARGRYGDLTRQSGYIGDELEQAPVVGDEAKQLPIGSDGSDPLTDGPVDFCGS